MRIVSCGSNVRAEEAAQMTKDRLVERIIQEAGEYYKHKEMEFGAEVLRHLEQVIYLQTIDSLWKEHLLAMEHLKEGIGLRGYGQRNPLQEYQKEGYEMFMDLVQQIKEETISKLFRIQIAKSQEIREIEAPRPQPLVLSHGEETEIKAKPMKREGKKVGRNDPCPCGSGKKYKKCHGR